MVLQLFSLCVGVSLAEWFAFFYSALMQINFVMFVGYAHLVPSVGRLQNVFEFSFCLFVH